MRIKLPQPKLRLYQQIIVTFLLVVLIPLTSVSFIIYSINQTALRKELLKFTEHATETFYKDFSNEMHWQREQSRVVSRFLLDSFLQTKNFSSSASNIFRTAPSMEAVGLYDAEGNRIYQSYRHFQQLSPELRLPDKLTRLPNPNTFQVKYFADENPQNSPYLLQTVVELNPSYLSEIARQHGTSLKKTTLQDKNLEDIRYYVQLKHFNYLQNVVRSNREFYDGMYIVDNDGYIIAGPRFEGKEKRQISPDDFAFFTSLKPGVTKEFSTTQQTLPEDPEEYTSADDEDEEAPPLQKVFVKMPDINWGVIIESPYHVRQKYIKRARNQTLGLMFGCMVLVILLALIYVYGIYRNFRQLIKGTRAMAEGNYGRRIRLLTNFFTPYEIVYLAGEFNRMGKRTKEAWQTIQEKNKELAKLDELKSNLIDTVSHELRTPLTSIKGYTSRLIRYNSTFDTDTRKKNLKVIKQQADRLGRMVEDLLVIPDLEQANLRVFLDEVDLVEVVDRSVEFIHGKEKRTIDINYVSPVSREEGVTVLADPDRLEQILLNILDNAVKYSIADSTIDVTIEDTQSGVSNLDNTYAITISNDSEPIPEEEVSQLFEKFKRLDESLVRTTRGSGLGLFITKGLVEAMGGTIELQYHDDRFHTRFTIPKHHVFTEAEEAQEVESGLTSPLT